MPLADLLREYGYYAVFLGTFLEGETVLVMAGFAAHSGYLQLPWVIAVAGGTLGDQLYFSWAGAMGTGSLCGCRNCGGAWPG